MNKPANLPTVEDALNGLPQDTLHSAMARAFSEIDAATKDAIGKVLDYYEGREPYAFHRLPDFERDRTFTAQRELKGGRTNG